MGSVINHQLQRKFDLFSHVVLDMELSQIFLTFHVLNNTFCRLNSIAFLNPGLLKLLVNITYLQEKEIYRG